MSELEIDKILNSINPQVAFNSYNFEKLDLLGYEKTQKLIRQNLQNLKKDKNGIINTCLTTAINKNKDFEPHKNILLNLIYERNEKKIELWSNKMKESGFSKQAIFDILSELYICIQFYDTTKDNELYDDFVTDFLDRFTYFGRKHRIYPNEPDVK